MGNSSTLTRFLIGLSALIILGVGLRLMYYGLQTQLSSSPSLGILAFLIGIVCFVAGILIGVLLFDRYSRRV
jgi:hypothetical protein